MRDPADVHALSRFPGFRVRVEPARTASITTLYVLSSGIEKDVSKCSGQELVVLDGRRCSGRWHPPIIEI